MRFSSAPFIPPYWLRQRWNVCPETSSRLATSAVLRPSGAKTSASRSFARICSGVCRRRDKLGPLRPRSGGCTRIGPGRVPGGHASAALLARHELSAGGDCSRRLPRRRPAAHRDDPSSQHRGTHFMGLEGSPRRCGRGICDGLTTAIRFRGLRPDGVTGHVPTEGTPRACRAGAG